MCDFLPLTSSREKLSQQCFSLNRPQTAEHLKSTLDVRGNQNESNKPGIKLLLSVCISILSFHLYFNHLNEHMIQHFSTNPHTQNKPADRNYLDLHLFQSCVWPVHSLYFFVFILALPRLCVFNSYTVYVHVYRKQKRWTTPTLSQTSRTTITVAAQRNWRTERTTLQIW